MKNNLSFCVPLLLLSVTCFASCTSLGKVGLNEKERMARDVLRKRMSLDDAKQAMETIGFECRVLRNESLISDDAGEHILRGVDYLNCVAQERKGMVTGILSVKLLLEDDIVQEIYVVRLLDGL